MSAVGAERRALDGAEHRSSMDRVMAGASAVVQIVVIFRARTRTCCFAASLLSIGGGIRPCIASSTSRGSWSDLSGRTRSDCPDNRVLIAAHMSA